MITDDIIAGLKQEYGNNLFLGYLGNKEVVFKPLSFGEYKYVVEHSDISSVDLEEYVITKAVIYPSDIDIDSSRAGDVSMLCKEVIEHSAFSDVTMARNALEEARQQSQNVFETIKAIILAAMPTMDVETLNEKNFYELAGLVVLAENIFRVQREAIETDYHLEVEDPDEPEDESKILRKNQTKLPGQAKEQDPIAQKLKQALQDVGY